MSLYEMSPHLISKIEDIIDLDYKAMGVLAEISDDIRDPTLRAIIHGIIGDENGHIRFFRSLLVQTIDQSLNPSGSAYDYQQKSSVYKRYNRSKY